MADERADDKDQKPKARAPYQTPRLRYYGTVSALTAGGSGLLTEAAGGMGMSCGMGSTTRMVNPACP